MVRSIVVVILEICFVMPLMILVFTFVIMFIMMCICAMVRSIVVVILEICFVVTFRSLVVPMAFSMSLVMFSIRMNRIDSF